jgi:hypothetical protein
MLHLIYLVSYYFTFVAFSDRNTLIAVELHLTFSEDIQIRVQGIHFPVFKRHRNKHIHVCATK